MTARTAEALRQALDGIAVDIAAEQRLIDEHMVVVDRLVAARSTVEATLVALGEDPDVPSIAELEAFRPATVTASAASVVVEVPGHAAPAGTSATFTCTECGKSYPTQQGLRIHRGQSHKRPRHDEPTVVAATPAPRPGALVLACSDCSEEFATTQIPQLGRHAAQVHGRRPTAAERMPVNSMRAGS